jgi:hypothetical protein
MTLPTQQAMWTDGPSFPTESPEAMASGCGRPVTGGREQASAEAFSDGNEDMSTHQRETLDDERPSAKVTLDDCHKIRAGSRRSVASAESGPRRRIGRTEAAEDALDLGDAGARRVRRESLDEVGCRKREPDLE